MFPAVGKAGKACGEVMFSHGAAHRCHRQGQDGPGSCGGLGHQRAVRSTKSFTALSVSKGRSGLIKKLV